MVPLAVIAILGVGLATLIALWWAARRRPRGRPAPYSPNAGATPESLALPMGEAESAVKTTQDLTTTMDESSTPLSGGSLSGDQSTYDLIVKAPDAVFP